MTKRNKLRRAVAESCIDMAHERACKEWRELWGRPYLADLAAQSYGEARGLETAAWILDKKLGRPPIADQRAALRREADDEARP